MTGAAGGTGRIDRGTRTAWTASGQATALAAVALLAGAVWTRSLPLLGVAAAAGLAVLLDAAFLAGTWPRAKLSVPNARIVEGRTHAVEVLLERASARHEVRLQLPPHLGLAAGRDTLLHEGDNVLDVTFPARGPTRVGPVVARRIAPLGLWGAQRTLAPAMEEKVIPGVEDADGILLHNRVVHAIQGRFSVNRPGQGFDFFSLRPYEMGDTQRSVNWKASARLEDNLIVNQRQRETYANLTVFLDARLPSGAGPAGHTPLDRSCRVALALLQAATRNRDQARLVLYGADVQLFGERRLEALAVEDALAAVRPDGVKGLDAAWAEVEARAHPRGPVIVLSALEGDPGLEGTVAEMVARHLPVTVLSPRPVGPSWDTAPRRHAARDATIARVRATGAMVVDWLPGVPPEAAAPTGVLA